MVYDRPCDEAARPHRMYACGLPYLKEQRGPEEAPAWVEWTNRKSTVSARSDRNQVNRV